MNIRPALIAAGHVETGDILIPDPADGGQPIGRVIRVDTTSPDRRAFTLRTPDGQIIRWPDPRLVFRPERLIWIHARRSA